MTGKLPKTEITVNKTMIGVWDCNDIMRNFALGTKAWLKDAFYPLVYEENINITAVVAVALSGSTNIKHYTGYEHYSYAHSGVGQDVPKVIKGQSSEGHFHQPLRHHAGGRPICPKLRKREVCSGCRMRPVRRLQGTVLRTVCTDAGGEGIPHIGF